MSNKNFKIVGICTAVAAAVLTITLCIVCLRVLIGPGSSVDDTEISDSSQPVSTTTIVAAKSKPKNPNPNQQLAIMVDEDELAMARSEERRRMKILEDVDKALGKTRSVAAKDRLIYLSDLRPEDKNRVWWKIAQVAENVENDELSYKLTMDQARSLAKSYKTSVLEVFTLFRAGAHADWRTAEAPIDKMEKKDDKDHIRDSWLDDGK